MIMVNRAITESHMFIGTIFISSNIYSGRIYIIFVLSLA